MRTITIAAMFFAAMIVSPALVGADDVDPTVARAEALGKAGKDADAIKMLDAYIATHPKDARALVDRGDSYMDLNKPKNAVGDYTAAIAANPQYSYAWSSRCDAYNALGNYKAALSDCDKALQLNPSSGYAARTRAITYDELGDDDSALKDATLAVNIDPNSASALAIRCRVLFALKKFDTADQDCLASLGIDPTLYRALFWHGRIAIEQQNWAVADTTFTKILKDDDEDASSHYWRAIARMHLGTNNAGAYADADAYVHSHLEDGDGYYLRALIEQQMGRIKDARDDANLALYRYKVENDNEGIAKATRLIEALR